MNLEHTRTIAVSQEFAFAAASDFARFEREGAGGAQFKRIDQGNPVQVGAQWNVNAEFRGRPRRFVITLVEFRPNDKQVFKTGSSKFDVHVTYSFKPAGAASCEMTMRIETAARSLAGRLIFQTLQLARGRFERYLGEAALRMATQMEAEYKPT